MKEQKPLAFPPSHDRGATGILPQPQNIERCNGKDDPDHASINSKGRPKQDRGLKALLEDNEDLPKRTYGRAGIHIMLRRSISADADLNRYLDLQRAAGEVDNALKTHDLPKNAASHSGSHQRLLLDQSANASGFEEEPVECDTRFGSLSEDKKAVQEARRLEDRAHSESERDDGSDEDDEIELPQATDPAPPYDDQYMNQWGKVRYTFKEFLAEWLGVCCDIIPLLVITDHDQTTITITIGLSGSMVRTISPNAYGNVTTSSFAWGFAVMLGIYVAGGVSGGHLNPAISILLSINRGFPWDRCAIYILAQILGAFTAGCIAYGLYRDAIIHYQGTLIPELTGIVFYTQPRSWVTPPTAFFNEFTGTAILACSVLALGDDANAPAGAGMGALVIGFLVTALTMAFGFTTGGCFNPARDIGPRLVAWIAGYGSTTFTAMNYWWIWGPWCATISGALFGGAVYDVFIFVGGDSPINYPPRRRKKAAKKWQIRWLSWLGQRDSGKVKDLEKQAQKHSD